MLKLEQTNGFLPSDKILTLSEAIIMLIGAQLYTLRDYCKDEKTFAQTLAKVSDIGYTSVQVSGTCPYSPEWLASELKKNGLTCDLTHIAFDRLTSDPETVVSDHKAFGCRYIGIGGYNGLCDVSDLETVVNTAKKIAPILSGADCLFMYHNHFTEFMKNEKGLTRLLELVERTTPSELGITLDTYWVQYGGADIADYVKTLKGRIPCVHFKDMKVCDHEVRMAPVGDGNINFEKLLPLFEDSGTEYIFVEQDLCYDEDPFECLNRSKQYLASLGLR